MPIQSAFLVIRKSDFVSFETSSQFTMKIAWGKNAKPKRQPILISAKPDLPFGVDSDTDEADKKEGAESNLNSSVTEPSDTTAESLQHQGNKLAEVPSFL
jgi:hypothetical protein